MPNRLAAARNPDTVVVMAACMLAGLVQLVSGEYPGTVLALVSEPWAMGWAWSLVISAALCLLGVMVKDDLDGWVLQLSGRLGLAPTAAGYAFAIWSASGSRVSSALVLAFSGGVAIASGVWVWMLTRRLNRWFRIMSQVGHPSRWRVVLRRVGGGDR